MSCRFPKSERLNSKIDIDRLFEKGKSVRHGALALRWLWMDKDALQPSIKVLIVVPKRYMKRAVDRNRTKRQLRELYRLNKDWWPEMPQDKTLIVAVMYLAKGVAEYQQLEGAYAGLLKKFENTLKRVD